MKTTFMLFCSRNYKNCHDPPFVSLAADSQKLFPNFLSEFHGRRQLVIEPTMEVNRFHTAVFVILLLVHFTPEISSNAVRYSTIEE